MGSLVSLVGASPICCQALRHMEAIGYWLVGLGREVGLLQNPRDLAVVLAHGGWNHSPEDSGVVACPLVGKARPLGLGASLLVDGRGIRVWLQGRDASF